MPNLNNPIRCFEGNAKPYEPFWRWVNVEGGEPTLELDGVLSQYSWFEDDITPKKFKDDLYKFGKGGPVKMRINSPGGDVIAASVIRSIMTEYPDDITVQIDGMAASAAVIVAISGKRLDIMDSAYMMIHDPAVVVLLATLDIQTLGKLRDDLQTIKNGIVPAYAKKTGLSEERISAMMKRETWMSASEAVGLGFADSVIEGGQKTKSNFQNVAYVNVLQSYQNVPPALTAQTSAEPAPQVDVERESRVARLREKISKI